MATTKFDFGSFLVVDSALSAASTTFTIASSKKFRKGQDNAGVAQYYEFPNVAYTDFRVEVEEKGGARVETIGIASVVDASNDFADGRKRYTLTVNTYDDATLWRGYKQDNDGTNAVANKDTDLIVDNFPIDSKVKVVWDQAEEKLLFDTFEANVATRFTQPWLFNATTDVTTGNGRAYFLVPAKFNANDMTIANARVVTAGTTGDTTINIYNETTGAYIFSTPITIASGAVTGSGVIDAAQKTMTTGDWLRYDILTASATPAKGLAVNTEYTN